MNLNLPSTFYMTLQEKRILKSICSMMLWMIEYRALISNNGVFTHKNLLRSGISHDSFGWISINSQLSLYDNGMWTEILDNEKLWVHKVIGDKCIFFNSTGDIIQKPSGGRKFLIQFAKHVPIIPCDGKQINVNELLKFYEASKNIFKL